MHGKKWAVRAMGLVVAPLMLCACAGERDAAGAGRAAVKPVGHRVVVMAPAAAEMLEALGALDLVVGIGDFVQRPASIAKLPRVGAYDRPNVERVLELGADLFLSTESQAAAAAHGRLDTFGVQVVALDTSTYEGVFASLARLGRLLDRQERAGALEQKLRGQLAQIRRTAQDLPPRSVLFVVGRDPVYVAGPGSHVDEMIAMVGGTNVFHDAPSTYHRVSMEAVLERLPEVIIDTSDNGPRALRGSVPGDWGQWEFLPAVRRQRVYLVDPSRLVIPGIRLPEMTRLMGKLIQAEAFGKATYEEMVRP